MSRRKWLEHITAAIAAAVTIWWICLRNHPGLPNDLEVYLNKMVSP